MEQQEIQPAIGREGGLPEPPMKLYLADNMSLSADAVTQTFVLFSKRGSGKTNGHAPTSNRPMVPCPGL